MQICTQMHVNNRLVCRSKVSKVVQKYEHYSTVQYSVKKNIQKIYFLQEAIQAIYNAALASPDLSLSEKYTEYVQRVRSLQAHCK